MQQAAQQRRARQKQFWGVLVLFLAGTLGLSTLLQRLVSPLGNAVVAAAQQHDQYLTGLLLADRSSPDRYTVFDGTAYHPVTQSGGNLQTLVGQRVTLAGNFNPTNGSFEVSAVRIAN